MFIVRITAGLGNQMFQYALYRALIEQGKEVYLDISDSVDRNKPDLYQLKSIFPIIEQLAIREEIDRFKINITDLRLYERMRRKLTLMMSLPYKRYVEKKYYNYDKRIFNLKGDYYLDGYWQSEKYFSCIGKKIREEFKFIPEIVSHNMITLNQVRMTESVSIHIRRGDYVKHPWHGGICDLEYYQKAIKLMKNKVNNPFFFIFSDDPGWCKENLLVHNSVFIDWNHGLDSFKDMQLMSNCRHNIIANSSFSWWGAWLNTSPDKIVIAPSRWLNNTTYDHPDIVPYGWIKL